ncbi:hypothetical protein KY290_014311 [Solanum tuberosum]|uniref:Uncharacterized protein n=1 Tax=Solanum tuberosum TaxID=4113 RepID=A0ABQ7VPX6_SOLTU|nr:hypothetical protein KY289_014371 [Solanum tuberosum]KAH0699494.1 hypothetical protein KY284_013709 [Solanum tuberosum]KAH0770330.1 hypothetical protein KY290_014311 [Solanum tuberosum]
MGSLGMDSSRPRRVGLTEQPPCRYISHSFTSARCGIRLNGERISLKLALELLTVRPMHQPASVVANTLCSKLSCLPCRRRSEI